jgi:hypothetical protein
MTSGLFLPGAELNLDAAGRRASGYVGVGSVQRRN